MSSSANPLTMKLNSSANSAKLTFVQPLHLSHRRTFSHAISLVSPGSKRYSTRPSHSSAVRMSSNDLLVVGAGHLGTRIAKRWRQLHPSASIVGETKTETSHAELRDAGITPALAGTTNHSFSNVVFCVPPRGDPNYKNIVEAATKRASRRFVFTSSTSVHAGAECITEDTPARNEGRASFLYQAEEKVLQSPNA